MVRQKQTFGNVDNEEVVVVNEEERQRAQRERDRQQRAADRRQRAPDEEHQRLEEERLRQAARRHNETEDERDRRQEEDRLRQAARRQREQEEERLRQAARQQREEDEQHEHHLQQMQLLNAQARQRENPVERERRLRQERLRIAERRRNRPTLHGIALQPITNNNPAAANIGTLGDHVCPHCQAKLFRGETTSLCCRGGMVQLDRLREPPDFLRTYLEIPEFRTHIRQYNSALATGGLQVQLDESVQGHGPYCYRVHGQIYHTAGHANPAPPPPHLFPGRYSAPLKPPMYGQLYFMDPGTATEQRLRLAANHGCDRVKMEALGDWFLANNPYAQSYKNMKTVYEDERAAAQLEGRPIQEVTMVLDTHRVDRRRYNAPTQNEVAAIIVGNNATGELEVPKWAAIRLDDPGHLTRLSLLDGHIDPMCYPLIFPYGEQGWKHELQLRGTAQRQRTNMTMLNYFAYRLQVHDLGFSMLHHSGHLFHQYVVDAYLRWESNTLDYISRHQKDMRAETYTGLINYLNTQAAQRGLKPGKIVILPSSFTGSPRAMKNHYHDAMAMCRRFGKPDLFITFTCNPNWPEIRSSLFPGQSHADRPDIVARVYWQKLGEFLTDLLVNNVLGKVIGYTWVIEFQKRGLPHMHFLGILADEDKPRDPDAIDRIVSAEIPDPAEFPILHKIVVDRMMHGPCGSLNPQCVCMEMVPGTGLRCSKNFPKAAADETVPGTGSYPIYRRRNRFPVVKVIRGQQVTLDDRWVVPYNPYLLQKYDAHINVEICSSVKAYKYIYKYICKGHDCAKVRFQTTTTTPVQGAVAPPAMLEINEITNFVDTRYISAPEAIWRLLQFPMQRKSHTIVRLEVHLPNEQTIYFDEDGVEEAVERATLRHSKLIAWFRLNQQNLESLETDENGQRRTARDYLYHEIPEHYTWIDRGTKWKTRQRGGDKVIGRMISVSPEDDERFHLRLLLLHVHGVRSYEELRTLEDGTVCATYKETAVRRGLLLNDDEWVRCLEEAAQWQMPDQLCHLFAMLIVFAHPHNAAELWVRFLPEMKDDFVYRHGEEAAALMCYNYINEILTQHSMSLERNCQIPAPAGHLPPHLFPVDYRPTAEQIAAAATEAAANVAMLNTDQLTAFEAVTTQANPDEPVQRLIFLDAPGGTGKTKILNTLVHWFHSLGQSVLTVAYTGIAATLLIDGKTVHSTFKLPLDLEKDQTCNMTANSAAATPLRNASAIIWDEAPMAPREALEAIDKSLQNIMGNNRLFGGKTMVLGGDFRQLLPVIRRGSKNAHICRSLKRSPLWQHFRVIHLTENMRVGPGEQEFAAWLLKLGGGQLNDGNGEVNLAAELPECLTTGSLVDEIFGTGMLQMADIRRMENHVILSPRNDETFTMNTSIVDRIEGEARNYLSIDTVVCEPGDNDEATNYPPEFLYSLTPSGLPPHCLTLKVGAIVMLLRNLNLKEGLVNGTRLMVLEMQAHVLKCEILTGTRRGNRVLIPRITLSPKDMILPVVMQRRQFPVRLAFSLTINKAQGQTFDRVGLLLNSPVFSHGSFYCACSRVRSKHQLRIKIAHPGDGKKTANIVYEEILS